jgi:hypothetical protein
MQKLRHNDLVCLWRSQVIEGKNFCQNRQMRLPKADVSEAQNFSTIAL